MKIRTGFVSNSSSSSFIALLKHSFYEKLKLEFGALKIAVLDSMVNIEDFDGTELIVHTYMRGDHFEQENDEAFERFKKLYAGNEIISDDDDDDDDDEKIREVYDDEKYDLFKEIITEENKEKGLVKIIQELEC